MSDDRKSRALTIRFSPVEAGVMNAVARKEGISSAAVVRRAVLGMGRELLSDAEWQSTLKAADAAGSEWERWAPPWRAAARDPLAVTAEMLAERIDQIAERIRLLEGEKGPAARPPEKEKRRGRKR
jgi:hypothetical protein